MLANQAELKKPILQFLHISKSFGAVRALIDVNIDIYEKEIHSILGQNGAGKSTLIKVLDNIYSDFGGEIIFEGKEIPRSEMHGYLNKMLGVVHQEFPLVPDMTVAENIFLDHLPRNKAGLIRWNELNRKTQTLLNSLNIKVSPRRLVRSLTMAERQLVSIAHAMNKKPKVLVFDEATSALTESETQLIFSLLRDLVKKGVAVIFISHKIEEILELSQKVTVLRDGESVTTVNTTDTTREQLIQMMAGKKIDRQFPPRVDCRADFGNKVLLEVNRLSGEGFHECTFNVHKGEILGIAGLVGSGHPEMMKTIFGAYPCKSGQIIIHGQPVKISKPKHAIRNKIFFIPSDRRREGALQLMNIVENTTIAFADDLFSKGGWINQTKAYSSTLHYIDELNIKVNNAKQLISELSGGNQQKVIISRWLIGNGEVLMFEEPTRGLDVGVKYALYEILNRLKQEGKAVIMISSELPELLAMSDRVMVMNGGKIVGEFENDDLDQNVVLSAMMHVLEPVEKEV